VNFGITWCDRNGHIPGGEIWTMRWLSHGYAPTKGDRLLAVWFDTDGAWSNYGLNEGTLPPLLATVKTAIEEHLKQHPGDISGFIESK
jgi:hypothetical protein